MTLRRATYFNWVRRAPFGGRISQQQVTGQESILDAWESEHANKDPRWLAYMLATAMHETGGMMVAVREGFARTDQTARMVVSRRKYGKPDTVTGHVYYGRGHVQLTWADNYKRMGPFVGVDLYRDPDKALDAKISVKIMFEGMMHGRYTGVSLSDVFTGRGKAAGRPDEFETAVRARKIVNGSDRAGLIASYHLNFLDALREGGM